jgi:hypothetical protein
MDKDLKPLVDFLVALETEKISHTRSTYLAHVLAVYHDMRRRGCSEDASRAGMFHSIYGTERFQGFKLPLERRCEIQNLIGERAECLAYLNCAMDRASFDRAVEHTSGPFRFTDRLTGQTVELNEGDFLDLCRVHLYDFLEQVARAEYWSYRREAYRKIAERLGGAAIKAFDEVYAGQPATVA